jgi:hypothetical protein
MGFTPQIQFHSTRTGIRAGDESFWIGVQAVIGVLISKIE